jgi:hypothetical protein
VVKAMIVERSAGGFTPVVIPGDRQLSLKKLGAVLGDKNVAMAGPRDVQRVTGYPVGAVSVLGYRRDDVDKTVDRAVLEVLPCGRKTCLRARWPGDGVWWVRTGLGTQSGEPPT